MMTTYCKYILCFISIIFFVIVFFGFFPSITFALQPKCDNARTTVDMAECIDAELESEKKKLNKLYLKLLKRAENENKSSPYNQNYVYIDGQSFDSGVTPLKKMHALWKKMLVFTCEYEARESMGGTAYSSILYPGCVLKHTNERVKYYQTLVENP